MFVLLQLILALLLGWMIFALLRIVAESRAAYTRINLKHMQQRTSLSPAGSPDPHLHTHHLSSSSRPMPPAIDQW